MKEVNLQKHIHVLQTVKGKLRFAVQELIHLHVHHQEVVNLQGQHTLHQGHHLLQEVATPLRGHLPQGAAIALQDHHLLVVVQAAVQEVTQVTLDHLTVEDNNCIINAIQ